MPDIDGPALAARVQGLIQGRFRGNISAAARELGVEEKELRDIVEHATDHPSLEALAAIVQRFGVDACWLLTGEYNWASHRLQLVEEEERPEQRPPDHEAILRIVGRPTTDIIKRSA